MLFPTCVRIPVEIGEINHGIDRQRARNTKAAVGAATLERDPQAVLEVCCQIISCGRSLPGSVIWTMCNDRRIRERGLAASCLFGFLPTRRGRRGGEGDEHVEKGHDESLRCTSHIR